MTTRTLLIPEHGRLIMFTMAGTFTVCVRTVMREPFDFSIDIRFVNPFLGILLSTAVASLLSIRTAPLGQITARR